MGECLRWERDSDDIITLTMDDPDHRTNTVNAAFRESLANAVQRLIAEQDAIRGVILTSAKETFSAGGDLNEIFAIDDARVPDFVAAVTQLKADLRALETLGKPVVAAINGAALGGGYEIALAAHHRVAVADARVRIGLPEVTFGLLPGGGGVARTVRLLGLIDALEKVLLPGTRYSAAEALELGLIDEVVPTRDELLARARAFIHATPKSVQRWDAPDYQLPGGNPSLPPLSAVLPVLPAKLRKEAKGAPLRAQHNILCAATEGALLDLESALKVETRYFIDLVRSQTAKNMIRAFWYDLNSIKARRIVSRQAQRPTRKVAVVGAGMMGAAIGYVSALAGIDVVLKDVSQEAAEVGKQYAKKRLDEQVAAAKMSAAKADEILNRIKPVDSYAPLSDCDIVIEAVFENESLKRQVYAEIDEWIGANTLVASNTSSLPITGLAESVRRPEKFIGLHFFSPVDKMPLVEVIRGAKTSDESLDYALSFVDQIKKTAIIVRDSRGFFTSRVIEKYLYEGMAMLADGVPAASIEQAARQAGYPTGVLQLCDEINLETLIKIRNETRAASSSYRRHPAEDVLEAMVERGRTGRLRGAGFYDYDEAGRRTRLWPGLAKLFPPKSDVTQLNFTELSERLLIIEAVEAARCLAEGVVLESADANIGSILGIGYPAWTGGTVQYINGYPGGVAGFVARAEQLATVYGDRFAPNALLRDKARDGALL